MANNMMAYKYFVGFNFSDLEYQDQHEVRKGINEGYLRLEPTTRIVREAYTVPPASSFKDSTQARYDIETWLAGGQIYLGAPDQGPQ